jgi:hypothetical protein
MLVMFIPFEVVGLIAMTVALWRTPGVPRIVPWLTIAVLVADVVTPSDPAYFHAAVFIALLVASGVLAHSLVAEGGDVASEARHTAL